MNQAVEAMIGTTTETTPGVIDQVRGSDRGWPAQRAGAMLYNHEPGVSQCARPQPR